MKTVCSKYKNVMVNVEGVTYQFREGKLEVPDDVALKIASRTGYWLSTADNYKTASRVLISRNMGLGDVLFVSTVPAYIKKVNPKCKITFATFPRFMRVLEKHPYIDQIEDITKIEKAEFVNQFDHWNNFNNFFETSEQSDRKYVSIHRVDMLRSFYGANPDDWDPQYFIHVYDQEREFIQEKLKTLKGKKIVAVVTQASEITRRYPDNPALIHYLATKGYGVIVISPGENTKFVSSNIVDLSGQTTVGQMIAALDAADLVITPDSGPLHVAGGLGKKIVTFFNSFPPISRTKYYKNCFAFSAENSCKRYPCMYANCPAPCLKRISPYDFYSRVKDMIGD